MFNFKKELRAAESTAPVPAEEIETDIKTTLETMTEPEEVVAWVKALGEYNEDRARAYLRAIKAGGSPNKKLWAALRKAEGGEAPPPDETLEPTQAAPENEAGEEIADLPEEVDVPVVNPDVLEDVNVPTLAMVLLDADSDDPKWSVFANSRPLCEIALSHQDSPESIRSAFVSDEYRDDLLGSLSGSMKITEVLAAVKASYYHAVTSKATISEQAKTAAVTALETEYAERLAALREHLLSTINLAVAASLKGSKGLFVGNGLKVAVIEAMRQAGVANPTPLVTAVFASAAQSYFTDILRQAEKWLSFSSETMGEISREVLGSEGSDDEEPEEDEDDTEEAATTPMTAPVQARVRSAAAHNVRVRTPHVAFTQPGTADDSKQAVVSGLVSRALGGHRR